MSQRIHSYDAIARDDGGREYVVHAFGEQRDDGTWAGWLRFEPRDGAGRALQTDRETTQPNLNDLEYWASGLEPTYIEGALARAREGGDPTREYREPPTIASEAATALPRAVINPYEVVRQGEEVLRQELGALHGGHLKNIVRAYELAEPGADLAGLTEEQLRALILRKVAAT